jgi:hypothetical protein
VRAVIVLVLSLACTPALADTDFVCRGDCPQFPGRGRSCSDIALACQGNCTLGRNTFNSALPYCTKMCGGERAACIKTGTWRGVAIIVNLKRN